MKFQECYKKLIKSLTDWTQYANLGPTSEYYWGLFDECSASDTVTVTAYTYRPVEEDKTEYWIGDGNYDNSESACLEWNYWPFEMTRSLVNGLSYLMGDDVDYNYYSSNMNNQTVVDGDDIFENDGESL